MSTKITSNKYKLKVEVFQKTKWPKAGKVDVSINTANKPQIAKKIRRLLPSWRLTEIIEKTFKENGSHPVWRP